MKYIQEIIVDDCSKWNEIVRSFEEYDVFYLNEYVTAFMKENPENGIPMLLYYENSDERAINVVFKRDVAKDRNFSGHLEENKYFDLISPYGYGGFIGNIKDYKLLNFHYNEYCRLNHYICEFVRFNLDSDYRLNYDGETETRTHNVVRSLDEEIDVIWMNFKQKVRKNVNRAKKNGLEIILDVNGEYLNDFLEIYYSTMDRSNAEDTYYFSKEFFETINQMKENIMYFHVLYESKIISTELVIFGSDNCYSYLGGTNRDFFELRPNDLLKFEIIKWAKKKGLKKFVLGGGHGADDGIFQYKACLAPDGIVDFYIGRKIFDMTSYEMLLKMRATQCEACMETKYFPKYRY